MRATLTGASIRSLSIRREPPRAAPIGPLEVLPAAPAAPRDYHKLAALKNHTSRAPELESSGRVELERAQ